MTFLKLSRTLTFLVGMAGCMEENQQETREAMQQLGGEHWETFYPRLINTLIANQREDGSWEPEGTRDTAFGNVYTSALTVLALTPPYQILPIYQR